MSLSDLSMDSLHNLREGLDELPILCSNLSTGKTGY